ncbi:hypothetical protein ACFW84_23650 [Streptomyces anulatus]
MTNRRRASSNSRPSLSGLSLATSTTWYTPPGPSSMATASSIDRP